ncbi:MAG: hypothetical protein ACD_71C00215G0005 [uncultured bacterium (gcode 4)]|uniref:Schlafen AlbA-2 domain-containing protein n=1 Tax=uncultured bacterium (gcode 4) TaxID=1234023 RepID=K1ZIF6_9BACT|nr:MAG: hypothetical protein ACD_71C00215G0005 [uncultured bacterium (gcode 4)]
MSVQIISKIDSKLTLEFILHAKESVIFERKWVFKPDGSIGFTPSKLADVIIGMLNAEGWVIVLWVSNGEIENLKTLENEKYHNYIQVVQDMILPPVFIQIEEVIIDEKIIIIYHINPDKERVFYRKDTQKVFLRNGDETRELDRDWARKLEYDKSIRRFEEEKRNDFDENDFRESVLNFYKKKINFDGDYRDLLVNRNLATRENGEYIYKNAAILLFAENPEKYIPSASLRYIRYDGSKQSTGVNLNVIKDERFEGSIPRIIELSKRFLQNVFRDYYYLDLETGKFVKIPEYPEDAWLEWLVNALTHRSYNLQWNVIYVKHFDDRLEISNSWPLPSMVTVENIKETRFSRNPRIARVLSEMGYVRELNEWVNRIYDSMKKSMLADPEYKDMNDIVTLTLRNKVAGHEGTISDIIMKKVEAHFSSFNATDKQILQFLFENNQASLPDLSEAFEKSDQAIRNGLNKLSTLWITEKNTDKIRDKHASYIFKKT